MLLAGLALACWGIVGLLDQLPFWCAAWVHQQRQFWRLVGLVIGVSAWRSRTASRLGALRAVSLSVSLVVALGGLGLMWYQLKSPVDGSLDLATSPIYGSLGKPNGRGFLWHLPDYHVRVHFDECSGRTTRKAVPSLGEIWCLGCSFTFGWGVADEETFAAVLARRHWPAYQVRNFGLPGRGLGESWLLLVERLAADPPPQAVVYGWIADQLPRNYRRKSWHQRSLSEEFLFI